MQTFKNPILQKRHYEFIADILKEFNNKHILSMLNMEEEQYEAVGNSILIKFFAYKLAESNPLFDKKKFLDRIGVK